MDYKERIDLELTLAEDLDFEIYPEKIYADSNAGVKSDPFFNNSKLEYKN